MNTSRRSAIENTVSSRLHSITAASQRNSAKTTCSGICSTALIKTQAHNSASKPPSTQSAYDSRTEPILLTLFFPNGLFVGGTSSTFSV